MSDFALFRQLLIDRRRNVFMWALSLIAVVALIAVSYATVEGEAAFEESLADLPESVRVLLGVGELSIISPAGYLNSQLFANFLPMLLSVFSIGIGARIIAGDEGDGHLELPLAYPITRQRLAVERLAASVVLLVMLGAVCAVTLLVTAPWTGLDVGAGPATAATTSSTLLALLHLSVAFGVGAATGSRGTAIGAGAAVTAGGFLIQSLANLSESLQPLRWLSPWHWFLDAPAIVGGWSDLIAPGAATLGVATVVSLIGIARFAKRDLRHN